MVWRGCGWNFDNGRLKSLLRRKGRYRKSFIALPMNLRLLMLPFICWTYLEDTFAALTDFPQRVVLVDEVPWRGKGIHRLPIKIFLYISSIGGGIYGKRTGSDSGHRGGVGT